MKEPVLTIAEGDLAEEAPSLSAAEERRIAAAIHAHGDAVYRVVRRHGVPARLAEDACQRVFLVFFRRFREVHLGREGAFLCATAVRVASEVRRLAAERHEALVEDLPDRAGPSTPEGLAADAETVAWLDRALAAIDGDARAIFVLYELENISAPEIAEQLAIPLGTVHTRLRRARLALREAYVAREGSRD